MPIYEYQCSACQHRLEALQKIGEAELSLCPSCKQESLRRLISSASFRLKGSGWYETDFRNKKKPAAEKPEASKQEPGDKKPKSEAPAESKAQSAPPAAKAGSDSGD